MTEALDEQLRIKSAIVITNEISMTRSSFSNLKEIRAGQWLMALNIIATSFSTNKFHFEF